MGKSVDKSFRQLYDEARKKPTPAQMFAAEVAQITLKSPISVRRWLAGTAVPDELTQKAIADHFGVSAKGLFPNRKNESAK